MQINKRIHKFFTGMVYGLCPTLDDQLLSYVSITLIEILYFEFILFMIVVIQCFSDYSSEVQFYSLLTLSFYCSACIK